MLHLGLVTYNIARDWDLPTLLARCAEVGLEGVELRTAHAHGVEPDLDASARTAVRKLFATSPVRLVGLGTVCEYHSRDPQEVRTQIAATKRWIELAADIDCPGVKVRPNGDQEAYGIPRAATLAQIAQALAECGSYAAARGVQIRLEMHGSVGGAADMAEVMRQCGHPAVCLCWNSNLVDVRDGSVAEAFAQVQPWIGMVHVTELWDRRYPWRELFLLLKQAGYRGFCLAEIPASPDPVRLLRYYRALWQELSGIAPAP